MPLCPELYRRLQERFGDVKIANEGSAAIWNSAVSAAHSRTVSKLHWPGEYYRVRCPFCQDRRHRLWINHQFGQLDARGWPMTFLAYCYNEQCLQVAGRAAELYKMIFGLQNRNSRRAPRILAGVVEDLSAPTAVKLPGEVLPIQDLPAGHPAVEYMVGERGYPMEVLSHYAVGYCTWADPGWDPSQPNRVRLAQGRVIIPIYDSGMLVGWQARYIGNPPSKTIPKYFTSPGIKRGQLLYNRERVIDKPFVVVVEGTTSAWRIGDYAVAMLGLPITLRQRQLLYVHWARRPVIFLLEDEQHEKMIGIINDMLRVDPYTPVLWDTFEKGTDPGSLSTEAVWNRIRYVAARAGIQLPV